MSSHLPFVPRGVLLAFGDSITQYGYSLEHGGWLALLSDAYSRKLDVLCRGYSGYNTTQALDMAVNRAPDNLPRATIAIVLFGANDASCESWQHVPVEQYKLNLARIVGIIRDKGAHAVVLVTPPVVHAPAWDRHCQEQGKPTGSRNNDTVKLYAQAVRDIAKEINCHLADLHQAMMEHAHVEELLCDGLHLSVRGNALLARVVMDAIPESLRSDQLLLDAPLWKEYDCADLCVSWSRAPSRK
jgi:isoamyl acetate esterase